MKKYLVITIFLLLCLVACKKNGNQPYIVASSPEYKSELPTSDGVLLLTIELIDNRCFTIGEKINISFTFWNLSDDPIFLFSSFSAGTENRFRYDMTTVIEDEIGSQYEISSSRARIVPIPDAEHIELSGGQYLETTHDYPIFQMVDIHFPVIELPLLVSETLTPVSYFLRLAYANEDSSQNSWTGIVSSNQVEICLMR